jgi:hypothetical protein
MLTVLPYLILALVVYMLTVNSIDITIKHEHTYTVEQPEAKPTMEIPKNIENELNKKSAIDMLLEDIHKIMTSEEKDGTETKQ